MLVSEWVDGPQDEGGYQGAEERPPESLQREVVRDLGRKAGGKVSVKKLKTLFIIEFDRIIRRFAACLNVTRVKHCLSFCGRAFRVKRFVCLMGGKIM